MAKATESSAGIDTAKEGKYLTFGLEKEIFGIDIIMVQEIISLINIHSIPRTPHYIRGVINLRGKVIPVIDLRLKFGMDSIDDTDKTAIIVVQVKQSDSNLIVGVVVDQVAEVQNIESSQIEPSPEFGQKVDAQFIKGMAKVDEDVVILLGIEKVFESSEIKNLEAEAN